MIRRLACILTSAVATLLLTGCYETKMTYTVNPDASGKVVLEATYQPMMLNFSSDDDKDDAEAKTRRAAKQLMEKSSGIDVWKDVTYSTTKDGRVSFTGTGYFRKIDRVKFQNLGDGAISMAPTGDTIVVTAQIGKDEDNQNEDGDEDAAEPEMTEAELQAAIANQKTQYLGAKPMMAGFFATMKSETILYLPGKVKASSNLKRRDDGALSLGFTGPQVLAAMDKLMANDEAVRAAAISGRDLMKDGPSGGLYLNEQLLGERAPIRVVLTGPFEPQFDYAAEVAAARKALPELKKALGMSALVVAEPVKEGEGLKAVTVGGVRLVRDVNEGTALRPFNQNPGYSLCILARFAGSIVSLDEAVIDRAVADTGQDLLPEREWDRKAHFPSLSEDRTAATFTLTLNPPDDDVRAIKELCGMITYRVAGTSRKADLGINSFTEGTKGTEFGATIKTVEKSRWVKGGTKLTLELNLDKDSIKGITFFDEDDFEMEFRSTGTSSWGDEKSSFDYTTEGKFPQKGRVVVEVYEAQSKYEVPFTIADTDLLGNPLKP